jgi:hypothetical protein
MRRILTLLVALGVMLLAACGKNNSNTPNAHLRVFHVSPDSGTLNVRLNQDTSDFQSGLNFETLTAYKDIGAGSQEVKLMTTGGSTQLDSTYGFAGDQRYTLVVFGRAAATAGLLLSDANQTPTSGYFRIRPVNLGNAVVDMYLLTGTNTVANATANLVGTGVGSAAAFIEIAKGDYRVVLTTTGTKEVLYDTGIKTFADQAVVTVIAYTNGSAKLMNGVTLFNDSAATSSFVANSSARVKTVQATPDVPLMDVLLDSNVAFSNIPYKGVSSYQVISAGSHLVQAQATATPGTFLTNGATALTGGKDYSLVIAGRQGKATLVPLTDTNFTPTSGKVRVRVVNVGLGGGPIDVLVNFVKQLGNVATNSASSYLEIDPSTTTTPYSFTFTNAGTTTAVLSMPSVVLDAGSRYTIYIVGNSPSLEAVITQDN